MLFLFTQTYACKTLCLFQLARLSRDDMNAVNNVRYMGGSDGKKASGGVFSLKFDAQKVKYNLFKRWLLFIMFLLFLGYEISDAFTVSQRKHAARKERNDEEETWQLSRFYPMIEVSISPEPQISQF